MVSESYSWSFLIDAQVRNYDGVVHKIWMERIFQWLQEGLNRWPLTCSAVTWSLRWLGLKLGWSGVPNFTLFCLWGSKLIIKCLFTPLKLGSERFEINEKQ